MPLTVELDGKQFNLSNECLLALENTLDKTQIKERGFALCQNTEVTPGEEVIGGRNSIKIKNCFKVKDEVIRRRPLIGFYHTHPLSDSNPSWHDALSIIDRSVRTGRPDLGCRGGQDGIIRCDTVKEIPPKDVYEQLRRRSSKMVFTDARDDPEIWQYFGSPSLLRAKDIPGIVQRVREEHFVGVEGRKFIRYFDTINKRRWTVEVK